ncbi:MAG: glycosyltransferase family 2 protein [Planctomycetia bacterium]|nr:glycosyltransferase family 2 protein [Planctomycetia bacterium]
MTAQITRGLLRRPPRPSADARRGARASGATVSVVVPCLNEEAVIGEFIDWCHEGLRDAGRSGQILIIDSSTDRSPEIARARGAEVLRVPRRGLGRAYIDALPSITGDYVIMGDCDLTYDFRSLAPFVEKLDAGYDFVMGSRFAGEIEPGSMPGLHRYFGTPVTTWVLNLIYGSRYSDIHCGMRAATREALLGLGLESQSWEYASEMVLKAARQRLKVAEVPVKFYKDREGRVSHHKRNGWLSPWVAGWINLKVMFLYAPDFFLRGPGWLLFLLGIALTGALSRGPLRVSGVGLDLHSMLLGLTMTTLGYSALQFATLARAFYNFDPGRTRRMARVFSYERGVAASGLLTAAGVGLNALLLSHWLRHGLLLSQVSHSALFGLLLIILGFQTFVFTLSFHMIQNRRRGDTP